MEFKGTKKGKMHMICRLDLQVVGLLLTSFVFAEYKYGLMCICVF